MEVTGAAPVKRVKDKTLPKAKGGRGGGQHVRAGPP